MSGVTYVGIAEHKILDKPGVLACSALGSCVAVCVRDRDTRLAGLLHALLPTSLDSASRSNPSKFADSGVALLVRELECRGARRESMTAKLIGGACLYYFEKPSATARIGELNVESARETLKTLGIPVVAEHVGGGFGRSVHFDRDTFAVSVNVLSQGVTVI